MKASDMLFTATVLRLRGMAGAVPQQNEPSAPALAMVTIDTQATGEAVDCDGSQTSRKA